MPITIVSFLNGCGAPPHPRMKEPTEKMDEREIDLSLDRSKPKVLKEIAGGIQLVERHPEGPIEPPPQPTFIYDRKGKLLAELFVGERHVWIGLDQMSPYLIYSTRSALEHAASAVGLKLNKRLLTTQLARLIRDNSENSTLYVLQDEINQKVIDELEESYTESELLALYINLLRYAPNAYGPEMAAQIYFSKRAADLNLGEATFLTALLSGHTRLDPILDFADAKQRRSLLIEALVQKELVTEDEARDVNRQLMPLQENVTEAKENLAPRFVQYVLDIIDEQLEPGRAIRSGWHIHTTLDLEMQLLGERLMTEQLGPLRSRRNTIDSALLALKPGTSEILVMVDSIYPNQPAIELKSSNRSEKEFQDVDFNNHVLEPHQPGSAIIPLIYAAALEENMISPATVLWDLPARFAWDDTHWYIPLSSDLKFQGAMSARSALNEGALIPAVKLIERIGPESLHQIAENLGMSELIDEDITVAVDLPIRGGQTSLLALTGAYNTLANGGEYHPTSPIRRILDARGEPIRLPKSEEVLPTGVSSQTAFLVTDMLMKPLNPDLVAATPSDTELSPLAKRSAVYFEGVSSDHLNYWTTGYTPQISVGIWLGETVNHTKANTASSTYTLEIWREFIQETLSDPELRRTLGLNGDAEDIWRFSPPEGVENLPECPPYVKCRAGANVSEYFTEEWLNEMEMNGGPLGDSVVWVPSKEAFIDWQGYRQLAGYCQEEDGERDMLLRLPELPGLQGPKANMPVPPIFQPDLPQEHLEIVKWSMGYSHPVSLGPCSRLERFIYSAMQTEWEIQRDERPVIVEQAGDLAGFNPSRPVGQWPLPSAYPSVYAPPPSVLPSPYRLWQIRATEPAEIPQEVLDSITESTGITFQVTEVVTDTVITGTLETADNFVVALPTPSISQAIPATNTPVSAATPTATPRDTRGAFSIAMSGRGAPTPLPESGIPRPGNIRPFNLATPTQIPTNTPVPAEPSTEELGPAEPGATELDTAATESATTESAVADESADDEAATDGGTEGTIAVADGELTAEATLQVLVFTLTPTAEGQVATAEPTPADGTPTPTRVPIEVTILPVTPTPTGTLTPEVDAESTAEEAEVETDVADDGTAEESVGTTAIDPSVTPIEENYLVADQYPYSSCAGEQVVGVVIDANTNPLPGVRLNYVDQWGNELTEITGGGFSDYGLFDFNISVETGHQIYITIVNDAGNPVSDTAVIDHQQGENVNYLCHYLVFRRIN